MPPSDPQWGKKNNEGPPDLDEMLRKLQQKISGLLEEEPTRSETFTGTAAPGSSVDHELEVGRLTPIYLRFYHAMYQAMLGAMSLALLANNINLHLPTGATARPPWRRARCSPSADPSPSGAPSS